MQPCSVTLDVDWAPDAAIDDVASLLVEHGVRATWLVTHASPAIDRLRERPDLFELGVHPNFLPGSTHGSDQASVLDHVLALVPDARVMRTHALVQSAGLFRAVAENTPIELDLSIYLPRAEHVAPVAYEYGEHTLTRLPYVWEDDSELLRREPRWDAASVVDLPGIKVFDFHPIHVHLNSPSLGPYERFKSEGGDAGDYRHEGNGVRTGFLELLERLEGGGAKASELV